MNKTRAEISLK